MDLIRTVSRDISPDHSSKECDCFNEFYQEKENQTDDTLNEAIDNHLNYAEKIESQRIEIEHLNNELEKTV